MRYASWRPGPTRPEKPSCSSGAATRRWLRGIWPTHATRSARRRRRPGSAALPSCSPDAALGWGSGQGGFEVPLHDGTQVALLEEALAAVGSSASGLRARLLSRLSVALSAGDQEHRRLELSEDAIAAAREVDDLAALGHALAAHCDAIAGPDHSEARRDEAGEIVELARRTRDRPLELLGRRLRAVASLELGDVAGFDADVARFGELADELRQPLYSWYVPLWRGLRALMLAAFDDAAAATDAARDLGRRAQSANAFALTFTQWWVAERLQGRFIASGDRDASRARVRTRRNTDRVRRRRTPAARASSPPNSMTGRPPTPSWTCCSPEVSSAARRTPNGCRRWRSWPKWPSLAGHAEAAAVLYDLLSPYAHRFCVEGIGAAFTGSVHWYLALLADALGNRAAGGTPRSGSAPSSSAGRPRRRSPAPRASGDIPSRRDVR